VLLFFFIFLVCASICPLFPVLCSNIFSLLSLFLLICHIQASTYVFHYRTHFSLSLCLLSISVSSLFHSFCLYNVVFFFLWSLQCPSQFVLTVTGLFSFGISIQIPFYVFSFSISLCFCLYVSSSTFVHFHSISPSAILNQLCFFQTLTSVHNVLLSFSNMPL